MSPLSIEQAMSKDVVTFPPDAPIRQVVDAMLNRNIGAVVIVDGERPVGIFSERDLMRGLSKQVANILDNPVSSAMTSNPVVVSTDIGFAKAMDMMDERKIRHLPVVESDRLVGILSVKDMLKAQVAFIREKMKAPNP